MRDAFYMNRAERIAASEKPDVALWVTSIHDAGAKLAEPALTAMILYGEAEMPNPTQDQVVDAIADALRTNQTYLDRVNERKISHD